MAIYGNIENVDAVLLATVTSEVIHVKGADGKDGASITISNIIESTADGGTNTVTFSDGSALNVKNGSKGSAGADGRDGAPGAPGTPGKDGTSITISGISESAVDGGTNTVTFSDGSALKVKNGSKGSAGADGTDGITPHIGENGNWYIASTDTGNPSRGATGPQGPAGAPGKDGAGMDITGATVGQIAKITAVDDTGKPTAWSPVDMPAGGGESAFEKVVEMTTTEDAAVISISTDKNGNPLSMSEFYVAITTARNSAATANDYFSCNVLPDTVLKHIRSASAIKNVQMFLDVYCYVMHYKVLGGVIFHEYDGRQRTRSSLNVAEYLENETTIGIQASQSSTTGFLTPTESATGVSKIDSAGKMYCITFDTNKTECIFGAGTRVEVWAR